MHFFDNFSNFINLFINDVTLVMTFEMMVWLGFVYDMATKMILLVFLFVLNFNVVTKITTINEVTYVFVVDVDILDLIIIDMVVKCYLLQILFRFGCSPDFLLNELMSTTTRFNILIVNLFGYLSKEFSL